MVTQNEFEMPLSNNTETSRSCSRLTDDDDRNKIWLDLLYNGKLGEKLVISLIKKLKRYFKEKINIVVKYRTNK